MSQDKVRKGKKKRTQNMKKRTHFLVTCTGTTEGLAASEGIVWNTAYASQRKENAQYSSGSGRKSGRQAWASVSHRKRTQVRARTSGSLPSVGSGRKSGHPALATGLPSKKRTQVRAKTYGTKARLSPKRGVCFHSAPYPHIFTIYNVCPHSAAVFPQGILSWLLY